MSTEEEFDKFVASRKRIVCVDLGNGLRIMGPECAIFIPPTKERLEAEPVPPAAAPQRSQP